MSTNGTKTVKGRISNKHGTEEYWILSVYTDTSKTTLRGNPFIPLAGELIIYDPDDFCSYRRFKFGDGVTNVDDLLFSDISGITEIDNYANEKGSVEILGVDGIAWQEQYLFYDQQGGVASSGTLHQRIPLDAGDNVEFGIDEESQVVKISVPVIGDIQTALDAINAQTEAIIGGN